MDEPQPAISPPHSSGQAVDPFTRFVEILRAIRRAWLFRTSSALVRWVILVAAVGLGTAFLVAIVVQFMASLIPNSG